MALGLEDKINSYLLSSKKLQVILKDTVKLFDEINRSKSSIGDELVTGELSAEEEEVISSVGKKPCFVILGDSLNCNIAIINKLFQQSVFEPLTADTVKWRTVHFRKADTNALYFYDQEKNKINVELWQSILPQRKLLYGSHCGTGYNGDSGTTDPEGDLMVDFNQSLLQKGYHVTLLGGSSSGLKQKLNDEEFEKSFKDCVQRGIPIVIYAISSNMLNDRELRRLRFIHTQYPELSVFFVRVPGSSEPVQSVSGYNKSSRDGMIILDEFPDYIRKLNHQTSSSPAWHSSLTLLEQLGNLGFSCNIPANSDDPTEDPCDSIKSRPVSTSSMDTDSDSYCGDSELLESFDGFKNIAGFVNTILTKRLVSAISLMNVVHVRCLELMINRALHLQRDGLMTPKRFEYVKKQEMDLYESLKGITKTKQDEIKTIITEKLSLMHDELVEKASQHQFTDIDISASGEIRCTKDVQLCTNQIQEVVLTELNAAIGSQLIESIDVLKESFTGVLDRCLRTLEAKDCDQTESLPASKALSEILSLAYQVQINFATGPSFVKTVIEKMKQVMQTVFWRSAPVVNEAWKKKVAINMLAALDESRCQNMEEVEYVETSGEAWLCLTSLASPIDVKDGVKALEERHTGRLEKTAEQRATVVKKWAPRVAYLCLRNRSLRDYVQYGKPVYAIEDFLGRGQYGTVYKCRPWGGFRSCAVKVMEPQDSKHWNDLSMEFYYYRSLPDHERITSIRGSVIDDFNNNRRSVAVLVFERLDRDLYDAIERHLPWLSRLQVAVDVVEGIRFLHSQGLIHRDIKLRNVLLDSNNRGKLTDLGFCKPEAMISFSVVGTPIHMGPELIFSGHYDSSVDVYAFGILFWYICSGHVRLPRNFDKCPSKESLWEGVKKGLRPEQPRNCDADCWDLMSSCWDGNADRRPLVGELEEKLRFILSKYLSVPPQERPLLPNAEDETSNDNGADDDG